MTATPNPDPSHPALRPNEIEEQSRYLHLCEYLALDTETLDEIAKLWRGAR